MSDGSEERSAFVSRATSNVDRAGNETKPTWQIAAETAIEIGLNGEPFAVMMATPANLTELGVGLAYTEQLLKDSDPVDDVQINHHIDGVVVDVVVATDRVDPSARRKRQLEGRAGCGLCGVESLAAAARRPSISPNACDIDVAAIAHAFECLSAHQPLNRETHSTHAAAWCDPDGRIVCVREDVGRHNALDKLVGAAIIEQWIGATGFVVMTSRMSFELVCKAATLRASLLATVSAPTTLALEVADQLSLPVACLDGRGGVVRFPATRGGE